MAGRSRLSFRALLVVFLPLLLACSGASDQNSAPPDAATPAIIAQPEATRQEPAPSSAAAVREPDGERVLQVVRHLSETIGPRPAGSTREAAAAQFLADQLRAFGYEVTLQEFPIGTEASRESSLAVRPAGGEASTVTTLPFEKSGSGQVRANLVFAGKGAPGEFPPETRGNIALIERGDLLFVEKVANAARAGAAAAVIFNNEPHIFLGSLQEQAAIPAVSISQADGRALLGRLQNGPVEAMLSVAALGSGKSVNVIARPPNRECETVSGGHYDSVQQSPGASDNATGTATVLEIAAVIAARGEMGGNCFVLFGAEEIGLLGSKAFVESLSQAQRRSLKAMLNFDMVGVGDEGWLLLGSPELQQLAADIARSLSIAATRGQLPRNTSSDHASFLAAGIPALMLYRLDDPLLHTPQDVPERVKPELLEQATRLGVAIIESLSRRS